RGEAWAASLPQEADHVRRPRGPPQREWRADAGERGGDPQRLRHDRRGRGRHGLQVGPLRRRAAP
ncbi:unnamed protein product, partial [Prorocentrum cordatum]